MNAEELREISNRIENRKELERIYKEYVVPELIDAARKRDKYKEFSYHFSEKVRSEFPEYDSKTVCCLLNGDLRPLIHEKGFTMRIASGLYVRLEWYEQD